MADAIYLRPELLTNSHSCDDFDSGSVTLNEFLKKHALPAQKSRASRTYVCCDAIGEVAGYYSLAYQSIAPRLAAARLKKGMPRHEIPVILLARLAVDIRSQGRGLGRELIRDAFLRAVSASDIAGCRALVVDAKDESAASFYERLGLERFESNPLRLFLLIKGIEKALRD